jgi:hypothetical protein
MSVLLPDMPGPSGTAPRVIDFGTILRPPLGGPDQRMNRIGNRYGVDVSMPVMEPEVARVWISRLARGIRQGVIMSWYDGVDRGAPGAIIVNGAGQAGSVLNVSGGAAGYIAKEGLFFSFISGGRRYLHSISADTQLSIGGAGALPIDPPLRIAPSHASVCEFAAPKIEGFLAGDAGKWTLDYAMNVGLAFSIEEAE